MNARRIVLAHTGSPESSAALALSMDREPMRVRDEAAPAFATLVRAGLWVSPEMNAPRAVVEESRKGVHGTAWVRLFKGAASVVGRKSASSLYNPAPPGAGEAADAGGDVRTGGRRLPLNKTLRKGLSCPS